MKKIKFRAWQKYHKKMVEVTSISFDDTGEINGVTTFVENQAPQRINYKDSLLGRFFLKDERGMVLELMQSTGLKDKNGVDIFEGDIVKITNTERFCGKNYTCYSEVKIIDGHVYVWPHPVVDGEIKRFGAKLLFSGMAKYIKDKGVATEDVEVIGTLYENLELLEVAE